MIQKKTAQTNGSRPARSRNNTEHKRAAERAQLYAQIIDSMPVGLEVWHLEDEDDPGSLRLVLSNPAAAHITGVPREHVLGKTLAESYPATLAIGAPRVFAKVIRSGKARHLGEVRYGDERIPEAVFSVTAFPLPNNCVGLAFENITERKQAEEALRDAKESAEGLLAAMQDGLSVLDTRGVHVHVNTALCEMTGFSRDELIGAGPPHPYWPPEEYEEIERAFDKTLRGRFRDFQLTFMRKNGERFPAIVSPSWTKDEQGNVVHYFATVKDITERKQAEETLRESEERLRKLSDATFEGIVIHRKGTILDANQALAAMFGYELSEVIGMHALDFAAPESRDLLLRNIVSGYQEPFEGTGLRKDGTTFPVEVCGRPIPYQGKMVMVAAVRDLTDRKRMEEALEKAREELENRVERQMGRGNSYGLTFRELTVLHLVAAGKADKEIGHELGISPLTASKHVANILSKMGAASRTEACVRALREGLLD
jgi:PAS domain S-box-containing protein